MGKQRPPSAKKTQPLPKPVEPNQSATSFYSDAKVDASQEAKLKKLAKPFSLAKKPKLHKPEEIDDMLSELSTPNFDEDVAAQKKYIEQILSRGRGEKEEQDLQECFDSLKKGSNYKNFDD